MFMKTSYSLKVQAIKAKGKKPTLYVYLPVELSERIALQPGELVEWRLVNIKKMHLQRFRQYNNENETPAYPLKVQAIRSKGKKIRMYVNIPLPLAVALQLNHKDSVAWKVIDDNLYLVRNSKKQKDGDCNE